MADKNWKVIEEKHNGNIIGDVVCAVATGGLSILLGGCEDTTTYKIQNKEGVIKSVTARNAKELGEKISKGKFD